MFQESRYTASDIINACVEMCTRNGRPFLSMNDTGFQKILRIVFDLLHADEIIINRRIVADKVQDLAQIIRSNLKTELKGRAISLKIDGVTRQGRCIMGLNVQFCSSNMIQVRTLAMLPLTEKHTGRYYITNSK